MHLLVRRIVNVGRTLSLPLSMVLALDSSKIYSRLWSLTYRTNGWNYSVHRYVSRLLPLIANGHGLPISFHRHVIFLLSGQRRREKRSGLGGGCRERGQFIFLQWNGFHIFISEFIGQKLFGSMHELRMKMKDVPSFEIEDDHGVGLWRILANIPLS